jgi:trigger factor
MQVNVENISSVKKKISFEVPPERVQDEIDKAFAEIRKRAVIPGFRKGKAPQDLIRKSYQGQIENDVVKNLFNDTYFKYVKDNGIFPVDFPNVDVEPLVQGNSFKYSATIEVFPEVSVEKYEGLKVSREKFVFDDKAVEQRLEKMRENFSQLKPLAEERPARLGDQAVIDFVGFVDGEKLENGDATDYQLELGSGSFIAGFEEQLVGMNIGEQKRIKTAFPEKYNEEKLSGKPVEFDVTLKDIKVKEVPEFDDAFAQDLGEYETFAELRSKVAETYEKQELDRIDRDFKDALVQALIESNELEIPDTLVNRQLENMLENAKRRLQYQNLTLEMMGLDEQGYKEQFRAMAANQVKGALLLQELSVKEGVEVTDEDIEQRIRKIAAESGQDFDRISKYYLNGEEAKKNLSEQIKEEKVLDLVASKAVITEVEKKNIEKAEQPAG